MSHFKIILYLPANMECASKGVEGARTRRALGHHLLHPLFFEAFSIECTRWFWGPDLSSIELHPKIQIPNECPGIWHVWIKSDRLGNSYLTLDVTWIYRIFLQSSASPCITEFYLHNFNLVQIKFHIRGGIPVNRVDYRTILIGQISHSALFCQ